MSARRVVITGIGAISPLGLDWPSTWQAMLEGKSGGGRITLFDPTNYGCQIAAEVKGFNPETIVDKKEARRLDRFSLFALASAAEAWRDSGMEGHKYNPARVGCILGIGIGGLQTLEDNCKKMFDSGPRRVSPFLIPGMISNLGPGNVAIKYGLRGVNYTITSACTSGTHAVGEAMRMIRDGLQDVIVTGGAEAAITQIGVAGFDNMTALTTRNDEPTKASRPFDKDRDGFLIGEGSATLILEEYEAAKKRGAKIYAEVTGYGFSCDAHHITAPAEGGEGAVNSMEMALNFAKLRPDQVQYVNAHGTSTPINDPAETAAIKKVFGEHAKRGLVVSSTKSMTGHLLGAAGGLEAAVLAMTVKTDRVPPTINLDNPDEGCDLDYVPNKAREMSVQAAISNSFGFGGTNGTVLIQKI